MKFITYKTSACTPELPGILLRKQVLDINQVLSCSTNMLELIRDMDKRIWERLRKAVEDPDPQWLAPLAETKLCSPIPAPARDILCAGVNYESHRDEDKKHFPGISSTMRETTFFSKRALYISGPETVVESSQGLDPCFDYEVELAVIIGRRGVNIPVHQAKEYIFGYSVFNDFTARSLQERHGQWFRGKSLDGFASMGPCIVHASAVPDPMNLAITCSVGRELRQCASTSQMITDIPHLIAELSSGMTLLPGDIIATGTPGGVGMSFSPPRFLKPGNTIICEVEGIGVLRNHIA